MERCIREAWSRREALHGDPSTTAYRVFHGWTEGVPGLEIDALGDVALAVCKSADPQVLPEAARIVGELGGFRAVVGRTRGQNAETMWGAPPEPGTERVVVLEHGLRYELEPWGFQHPGLYLDARPARRWLMEHSKGRRVLNLFAFAGSLGVAARAGEARTVIHVDSQKRALLRARRNHQLNGQSIDDRDLVREDVFRWLRKAAQGASRWGGVILDPPPRPGRDFVAEMSRLLELVHPMLDEDAWILMFLHHDRQPEAEVEDWISRACPRVSHVLWRGQSGEDYPEDDPANRLHLVAVQTRGTLAP